MDGVLVDFDKGVDILLDNAKDAGRTHEPRRKVMWREIKNMERDSGRFWYNLDPMSDADDLWAHVERHKPTVLTATGTVGHNVSGQKKQWIGERYGYEVVVITTISSPEKAQHAASHHVLIDDREKALGPWRAAGGIGVLHTSAADTIKQLKKLGL